MVKEANVADNKQGNDTQQTHGVREKKSINVLYNAMWFKEQYEDDESMANAHYILMVAGH